MGCLTVARKNARIMNLEIAKTCTAIKDGYFQNAKTDFTATRDKTVYAFAQFKLIDNKPYAIEFEWFSPSGSYHKSPVQTVSGENQYYEKVSVFQALDIQNMVEYGLLGKWRTVIRVNSDPVYTLEFNVNQ